MSEASAREAPHAGPGGGADVAARRAALAAALLGLLATLAAPAAALAQRPTTPRPPATPATPAGRPSRPPARPAARPPAGDSARAAAADTLDDADADTLTTGEDAPPATGDARAAGDSALVDWAEPDSAMTALLARTGYTPVRYQGDTVRFLAQRRVLVLRGQPAAVDRGGTQLVGAAIQYDDSAQLVFARGDSARRDTVVLRDPSQGADVVVRGGIRYDLAERRGVVSGFSTAAEQEGETWFVAGDRGAIVSDTTIAGRRVFYARDGSVTTCNDTTPHYHFEARNIKMVSRNLLVIRPATLYIGEVPVLWLPFVFSDLRPGRRSGLLRPQFGVAELLRNSPQYRRSVERLGYFFNFGDYADAMAWLDWRSGARGDQFDPGWTRFNAQTRYAWTDRFITGGLAGTYELWNDGRKNATVSWQHSQSFNANRTFSANVNWAQSTRLRRQNQIDPNAVLGTIASQLAFQDRFGPASFSVGGSAKQYPGREQRDLDFPNVNFSTRTVSVTRWLDWTPTLSLSNSQSFRIDQGQQFTQVYRPNVNGGLDSTALRPSSRNTSLRLDTPLKIFDFNWSNSFSFTEQVQDFPQTRVVYRNIRDTTTSETRVFNQTFLSSIDWNTSFSLPRFFQGSWNLSPTVSISNVDAGGLFVRTERSGGKWVRQTKRLSYGLSAAPTIYAFPRGFGRVERFRHSINPVFSYSYSPRVSDKALSDEYLRAIGRARQGYLGALAQNRVTLQLSTNLEAKLRDRPGDRARTDSASAGGPAGARGGGAGAQDAGREPLDPRLAPSGAGTTTGGAVLPNAGGSANAEGRKVRVLSVNFTSLSFDFARADSVGGSLFNRRGFVDPSFGYSARSDLVPGLDFRTTYSLFLGDPASDSAVFKPYRTDMGVTMSLDRNSAVIGALSRLLGIRRGDVPSATQSSPTARTGGDPDFGRRAVSQRVAGITPRDAQFETPAAGQPWQLSLTYTSSRQRPDLRGSFVEIDPTLQCRAFLGVSLPRYEQCVTQAQNSPLPPGSPTGQTTYGGALFRSPPQQSINANSGFSITQKWSAQWSTTYDVVRSQFASNAVSLQRELHDWRATFAFTAAPNGNFAFNFFIALKAEPDLNFPYRRETIRGSRY